LEIEHVCEQTAALAADRLRADIAAGNPPDIVGPVSVAHADEFRDLWLDLEPLVQSTGYDLSDFNPALVDFYRLPGHGLLAAWREAAGPAAAARAWPVCLDKDGRLVVAVKGNVWRQELTLLAPQLIEALAARGQAVAGIKLVAARAAAPPPPPPPPLPELTPAEEAQAAQGLENVADPELRQSLLSLRLAQMRAEKLP
jgi:hypothetical protein